MFTKLLFITLAISWLFRPQTPVFFSFIRQKQKSETLLLKGFMLQDMTPVYEVRGVKQGEVM